MAARWSGLLAALPRTDRGQFRRLMRRHLGHDGVVVWGAYPQPRAATYYDDYGAVVVEVDGERAGLLNNVERGTFAELRPGTHTLVLRSGATVHKDMRFVVDAGGVVAVVFFPRRRFPFPQRDRKVRWLIERVPRSA